MVSKDSSKKIITKKNYCFKFFQVKFLQIKFYHYSLLSKDSSIKYHYSMPSNDSCIKYHYSMISNDSSIIHHNSMLSKDSPMKYTINACNSKKITLSKCFHFNFFCNSKAITIIRYLKTSLSNRSYSILNFSTIKYRSHTIIKKIVFYAMSEVVLWSNNIWVV